MLWAGSQPCWDLGCSPAHPEAAPPGSAPRMKHPVLAHHPLQVADLVVCLIQQLLLVTLLLQQEHSFSEGKEQQFSTEGPVLNAVINEADEGIKPTFSTTLSSLWMTPSQALHLIQWKEETATRITQTGLKVVPT